MDGDPHGMLYMDWITVQCYTGWDSQHLKGHKIICFSVLTALALINSILNDTLQSECISYKSHNGSASPGAKYFFINAVWLLLGLSVFQAEQIRVP